MKYGIIILFIVGALIFGPIELIIHILGALMAFAAIGLLALLSE